MVPKTDREADLHDSAITKRLTVEEDDELRRLNYLSKVGLLSHRSRERMVELRLKDRRRAIREPREFEAARPVAKPRRRFPFFGR